MADANATLTGLTVNTAGTYQISDLQSNGFKFWLNSSNNLTGATQLGTGQATVSSGNAISVSGLSQIVPIGTNFILITTDVSYNANTSNNINISTTAFSNITFFSGNIGGSDPIDAGNTQSFAAVTPGIAITQLGPTAGNLNVPTTNSILYQLSFAVTTNSTDFNSITVTTGGTYQVSDLTAGSFKLWYNTTNTFGTATQIGTSQAIVASGNNITFSGLSKYIALGTTGYIWITVDASSGATNGRTINITSTAFSNIIFSQGTKSGTDPASAGGTQTFVVLPSLTEIILPQYIQGLNGTNTSRVPYAYLVTLNNLTANATYRYYNGVVISTDGATSNGAGNVIFINNSGDFYRSSGASLATAGNYGEFTTDGNGSYTGWFITEPTGNATRFVPGIDVYMRIILNDGAGGTTAATRLTTTNTVRVINFGATSTDGTGIRGQSFATPKNFIFLYDNVDGTGRPLAGTFAEADGTANTTANSYVSFYASTVNDSAGSWGTIIPNNLANGVRRVEERKLSNLTMAIGDIANSNISPDGSWNGINTVNPSGGTTAINIYSYATLPVKLSTLNSTVIGRNIKLNWSTASEINNAGLEIELKIEKGKWKMVGFVKGSVNTSKPVNYSFEDTKLNSGKYNYGLKQIDNNGNFEYFNLSSVVEIALPTKFDLSQNYPNPFNPVTKINFDLPADSKVTVIIYDLLGREVTKLLDNEFRTAGYYTVDFDASRFASGVYFYSFSADKFRSVKRMMLIK